MEGDSKNDEIAMTHKIHYSKMNDVMLKKLGWFTDQRGLFSRLELLEIPELEITSFAFSKNFLAGTTRGLHFQKSPHEQSKAIICLSGSINDYFLDLRPSSQSFGKWSSVRLTSENPLLLYLPKGFAHGFQTLEANTLLLYLFDHPFMATSSEIYSILDPVLDINLELPISSISDSDRTAKNFYKS